VAECGLPYIVGHSSTLHEARELRVRAPVQPYVREGITPYEWPRAGERRLMREVTEQHGFPAASAADNDARFPGVPDRQSGEEWREDVLLPNFVPDLLGAI
jgi:hypothetical protein